VAGPIVRAADFLPQLAERRQFARIDVRGALVLFLVGFIKKACISDNLAPVVDEYFANPAAFNAAAAWTATLYYAVQIYCDFSGYSDMAIACAALLGYRLCVNFRFPYLAADITDFWRRWHVSLSSWLRDYLYVPLGGNRGSRLFTYRNLMLTMLLGGLWHGAAWNFVVWGGLHGLALIVHREWSRRVRPEALLRRLVARVSLPLTFLFVCLCWIFFRAVGFEDAANVARAFLGLGAGGKHGLGSDALWLLPLLGCAHWIAYHGGARSLWRRMPEWTFAGTYALLCALSLTLVPASSQPFIYFQF
jgi:alginate O-acetyltransferase complex protein AlgI